MSDAGRIAGILAEAHDLFDDTRDLRRRIHRHPELGLVLPRTQAVVLEAIADLGLEIRTGQRTSSVVARLRGGKPGPTLLLRADMDALPLREQTDLPFASEVDGAMHACGHDAHTAMLVGAARILARRRDELTGSVVFMFQPGEEGYHGARVMLEEGLLDGPEAPAAAFGLHITPRYPVGVVATRVGAMTAADDTIEITVRGKGGHASAPHHCVDPVPIACEIVLALQALVTRTVDVFDPAVVTIGRIEAGSARNVIPETATLVGSIRTLSGPTRERVRDGVRRVADGIARAHGAEVSIDLPRGYPASINDAGMTNLVIDVARRLVGPERAVTMEAPIMAAEDFAYVLERVPGAIANLGSRPEDGPMFPNHSNRTVLNESALPVGVAMNVAVAVTFLATHASAQ